MAIKMVKLEEKTRILLNKARSKILDKNPEINRTTDDVVIRIALKKYVGV